MKNEINKRIMKNSLDMYLELKLELTRKKRRVYQKTRRGGVKFRLRNVCPPVLLYSVIIHGVMRPFCRCCLQDSFHCIRRLNSQLCQKDARSFFIRNECVNMLLHTVRKRGRIVIHLIFLSLSLTVKCCALDIQCRCYVPYA